MDGARFEQGAMGVPVSGWHLQLFAQRGGQVVIAGGSQRV